MAHIEPALVRGELYRDFEGNDILGAKDDFEGIDTPVERLADHAGIDLAQAALALDFARRECREDVFETAAELVGKLFAEILPSNKRSDKIRLDVVGIRTLAIRILCNRGGTETLTEWAERADISKQLLSHHLKSIEDSAGLHWLGGKRFEARAIYSESARQRWAALSPEERKARRAGKKNATAQDATPAAHLTTGEEQNENIPDSK
jgi:DNA-binding MarR family transcriptional regulator